VWEMSSSTKDVFMSVTERSPTGTRRSSRGSLFTFLETVERLRSRESRWPPRPPPHKREPLAPSFISSLFLSPIWFVQKKTNNFVITDLFKFYVVSTNRSHKCFWFLENDNLIGFFLFKFMNRLWRRNGYCNDYFF
jgi:hypothetical protein